MIQQELTPTPQFFKYDKQIFAQIFDSLKIPNVSNFFFLKKEPPKKHKFFIFLKCCFFVMGGSIDMSVGLFSEISVGFLKSVVLQLFLEYS